MYIIIESYAQGDPRIGPEIEYLDEYQDWMFDVAYIKPENVNKVDFSSINCKEVPEAVARACAFTNLDKENRIGLIEGSGVHQNLIAQSTEKHAYKPKVYYYPTEQDLTNLVEFMKTEMHLYLNYYYRDLPTDVAEKNKNYRAMIEAEINNLKDPDSCKVMLYKRFGLGIYQKFISKFGLPERPTTDLAQL